MKRRVSVGGTSKVFSSEKLMRTTLQTFFEAFDPSLFSLTASPNGDFLIAFNHEPNLYRKFLRSGGSPDRAVLIRFEPDSVFPAQYSSRVTKKYGLVISPGSSETSPNSRLRIGWPYQYHLNPAIPASSDPALTEILNSKGHLLTFRLEDWDKRSRLLTMVAGNKVSSISKANYSLRRDLARSLPRDVLSVYGPLWIDSLYPKIRHRLAVLVATLRQGSTPNLREIYGNLLRSYATARGSIANKHTVLGDSKFSLVIENSNTIVTEKIFDAILNGSIPIYVGPDLERVGLPSDIAISVAGTSQEILNVIQGTDLISAQGYLVAMATFLRSATFWENWEAEAVYKKLVSEIIKYLNGINE